MVKNLVATTNIGDDTELKKNENEQMKDIAHVSMTFDDKMILTIEKEKDDEAFIRAYILDEDIAGLEAHDDKSEQPFSV